MALIHAMHWMNVTHVTILRVVNPKGAIMSTSPAKKRALIVVTSHAQLGDTGKPTGYYLPEVTHPHAELASAGLAVDIASPEGGEAPLDPSSLDLRDPVNRAFWETPALRAQLTRTLSLRDVDPNAYDAVVFAGGHGTMWDFAGHADVARLIAGVDAHGGIVAAVCHGPAALVGATREDGRPFAFGKHVAAFSDAEEALAGLTAVMPFLLESTLVAQGARYSKAPPWQAHVVVDGRLVTGQNPASAKGVGEAVARLVRDGVRPNA